MKRLALHAMFAGLLSACALQAPQWPVSFLGDPAPLSAATKSIAIGPETRWVNVTGGETIRFDAGGKSFAWVFNVARGVHSFDLNRVAPPGMLDRRVTVYIAPDPRYIGGGEENQGPLK